MSGAKTCLIVVDALRYDAVPTSLVPSGFNIYRCMSLADTTEPSLTTILSGMPPWEHGIVKTGQRGAEKLLEKIKDRLLPSFYDTSVIISPAIIFNRFFTHHITLNRMEEIRKVASKYANDGEVDFMLLHPMDVHDISVNLNEALRYYKGFKPVPEYVKSWRPSSGLKRPYQDLFDKGDAGLLKACYKAAVRKVFREIIELLNELKGWRIVIVADHGESMIYFHHDSVPDDIYHVPLITNFELEEKEKEEYTHLDVYRLCIPD